MWYAARLLYESVVDDQLKNTEKLFEERIIVFQCAARDKVNSRIAALAGDDEVTFENVHGGSVTWSFREVLEVQELLDENIGDGTEVFFRFWQNPDSRDFETMRKTHEKPWWNAPVQAPASPPRSRMRAKKSAPARAS